MKGTVPDNLHPLAIRALFSPEIGTVYGEAMGDLILIVIFFVSIISAAVSMFCQRWWTSAALFISAAPLMGIPLEESGPVSIWAVAWVGWVVLVSGASFAGWRLWGNAPDTTVTARAEAVAAQEASEAARDAAVSARDEAVTAQGEAVASQGDAVNAAAEAQSDASKAVSARVDAETARTEAVTARGTCLSAVTDAVAAKDKAEAAKLAAEGAAKRAATARDEAVAAATKLDTFAQGIETLFGAHLVSLDHKECVKALIRSYVITAVAAAPGFTTSRGGSVQVKNCTASEKGILLVAIDLAGGASSGLTVDSKIDEVLAKL